MRAVFVVLMLTAPALADPPAPQKPHDAQAMHDADCAAMRKQGKPCKIFDMGEGEKIDGNGVRPDGVAVGVATIGKDASLIRLRREFIVEIIKTAEDL
ncbi:MAG TPA: hypothetical protein VLX92_20465 [Kofleriaceae bacterium]|nr:hypothetical protein [Kofleriaceae bacterium]